MFSVLKLGSAATGLAEFAEVTLQGIRAIGRAEVADARVAARRGRFRRASARPVATRSRDGNAVLAFGVSTRDRQPRAHAFRASGTVASTAAHGFVRLALRLRIVRRRVDEGRTGPDVPAHIARFALPRASRIAANSVDAESGGALGTRI